jgi:hypothetical protein
MKSIRANQNSKLLVFLNLISLGGIIINILLLIGAGAVAVSCLLGTIIYLISVSNEIQNSDIEKTKFSK